MTSDASFTIGVGQSSSESVALWLLRHGESTWNAAGRVQGQSGAAGPLTARGREQAVTASEELADQAPGATGIVSSDLLRARQTAALVARRLALPIRFEARLREQALGDLEGKAFDVVIGEGLSVADALRSFWVDAQRRPKGGESVAEMYTRVRAALVDIAAQNVGGAVIVVTHGGPLRAAVAAARHGVASLCRTPVDNAALLALRISLPPSRAVS